MQTAPSAPSGPRSGRFSLRPLCLLLDDGQHVPGGQDEVLLTAVLHLGAAVLAVDDTVADLDIERDAVAVVVDTARSDREDLALLGLLLRGVGNHQPGCSRLLGFERLDEDPVFEWLNGDRHLFDLPFPGCHGFACVRMWWFERRGDAGWPSSRVPAADRCGPSRWHTKVESANAESRACLALGQAECQLVAGRRYPAPVETEAFRALLTPAGQRVLATACADYDEHRVVALATSL